MKLNLSLNYKKMVNSLKKSKLSKRVSSSLKKKKMIGGADLAAAGVMQDYNTEEMLISITPDISVDIAESGNNLKLSSAVPNTTYVCTNSVLQKYDTFDQLDISEYEKLFTELLKSIKGNPNNLVYNHFGMDTTGLNNNAEGVIMLPDNQEEMSNVLNELQTRFNKQYSQEIIILTDPLLNDIDDCIAIVYLFHVCLESLKLIKKVDSTFNLRIVINTCDVETIGEKRGGLCHIVAEKLVSYCTLKLDSQTIPRSDFQVIKEINSYDTISELSEYPNVTLFLIRGLRSQTNNLLQRLITKEKIIKIIANGADTFSQEDNSTPSNVRCGTKIHDGSDRAAIFNDYLNFIKQTKSVSFRCFPLKRVDRPFTFKIGDKGLKNEDGTFNNNPCLTVKSGEGERLLDLLDGIRTTLNTFSKTNAVLELTYDEMTNFVKIKEDEVIKPLGFGDIIFPNVNDKIIDPEYCQAYSDYGSFLIDLLAIMSSGRVIPETSKNQQRFLVQFTETITESYETITDAQNAQDNQIRFNFDKVVDHEKVLKALFDHSEALIDTYFGTGIDSPDPKIKNYKRKEAERLIYKYLSKTPGTVKNFDNGIYGKLSYRNEPPSVDDIPREWVDNIHPRNALL